jgi:hypothetical protein
MQVADEAHERIERLNTWCATLHKRLWAIEDHLGLPHGESLELAEAARQDLDNADVV